MTDFYEEDETIEKVRAAYEHGAKGVTGPPPPRDPNQTAEAVVDVVIERTDRAQPVVHEFRDFPPVPASKVKLPPSEAHSHEMAIRSVG